MWRRSASTCIVAWSLLVGLASPSLAQLDATLVASGLNHPLDFVQDPSDPGIQVVLEQGGRVRLLKNGVLQPTDFLDLTAQIASGGERGLLGLAFAPDYASSGRVFVSVTNPDGNSVIARFLRSTTNPQQLDPASRVDLVWPDGHAYLTQPYSNHNGGNLAFGPDGYLYIGFGDGGSGNDPEGRAQDLSTLLGKVLRIDVNVSAGDPQGYDVPASNPFVGQTGARGEIWALGLRNPWRWSFDYPRAGSTGALVIADVGQDAWEEVDYLPAGVAGRNFGWRNREGAHDNVTSLPPATTPLVDPMFEYSHATGRSITGGAVYRGTALGAAYQGRYFFADFVTSRVWSLGLTIDGATGEATAGTLVEHTGDLGDAAASIASFGVDAGGELYVVNYTAGTVYRLGLVGGPPPGSCPPPDPYASAGGGLCADGNWYPPTPGGDFNGDHQPDLTWESTSGQVYVWFMNGVGLAGGGFTSQSPLPTGWLIAGTNDFTGDGHADLLVQNQSTGAAAIHVMNGLTEIGEQAIPIAANTPWRIVATGDFNTDGQADIVWENFSSGQLFVWFMGSSGGTAAFIGGGYVRDLNQIPIRLGPTSWRVVGTGDVNGDGHADLLWQDLATGSLAAWYLNGLTSVQGVDLSPARVTGSWQIRAVGDFNGDRHPDLIWQNPATGELYAWFLTGATLSSSGVLMPPRVGLVWQIVGTR